jgi:hypothetical protein
MIGEALAGEGMSSKYAVARSAPSSASGAALSKMRRRLNCSRERLSATRVGILTLGGYNYNGKYKKPTFDDSMNYF